MIIVLKLEQFGFYSNAVIHPKSEDEMANTIRSDQTAPFRSSQIRVHSVLLKHIRLCIWDFCGSKSVFWNTFTVFPHVWSFLL